MNFLFTPNHVQLLNSCYPPTSALLTAGPDYSPNSQELSRLTYYASNHPDKIAKLGNELEKRLRYECRKAQAGNLRARANLLITLAIFRSLATECRRDINLLSAPLVACVEATMSGIPADLEVTARAASLFTTFATYTNGHLIGTDNGLTKSYIACLQHFASLSCSEAKDHEVRNRTRLVGFAALTGAITSEALYNDSVQFRTQVAILVRPVLKVLLQTDIRTLDEQAVGAKDAPVSPHLAEFRTRPVVERRAASIHLHVDGETGPTSSEVSSAALRALFLLLENANANQLGRVMRSSFDSMDDLGAWAHPDHCCWYALKTAEWSQYQYRYAVPTWLIERLVETEDTPQSSEMQKVLLLMATSVFNSPIPSINLSTSDMLSNLMSLVQRKVTSDPDDKLLSPLVECISSLGSHVYYSDQIQDLAGELINRITALEAHGILPRKHPAYAHSRAQAIRCLLMGLLGLMHAANKNDHDSVSDDGKSCSDVAHKDAGIHERSSSRSRVPPDIWQDTLSLLCDENFGIRTDYAEALIYYLSHEMPKRGDDIDLVKRGSRGDGSGEHAALFRSLLHAGDPGGKLLHAVHSYIYILLTSTSLEPETSPPASSEVSPNNTLPAVHIQPATPLAESQSDVAPPLPPSQNQPQRSRKLSMAFRLLESTPQGLQGNAAACLTDYCNALNILTTIHRELPVRGLFTGVPMLLALDGACDLRAIGLRANPRACGIKILLVDVWSVLGEVWESVELVTMVEKTSTALPSPTPFTNTSPANIGTFRPPKEPAQFPPLEVPETWSGVDSEKALLLVTSNPNVQHATGLDHENLLSKFSKKWTAESALKESIESPSSFEATIRGDGVSPLIKLSPGFMHIDNQSLASLARSTRGIGVTDLREALEGRSSMSNPALARPSSISTIDHASSILGGDLKLSKTRSRTRNKRTVPAGSGEVRDVLNKLGLGKQNGSLLKASFPGLQQRS
ncbi:plasma membrane localization protein [Marasmius crinis-equi]|uniref:Plasma membrane localization protein n=1 Tax=Marasmius crinis-equi TaxID=585013 RepID=A0ABR3FPH3_9AGAR